MSYQNTYKMSSIVVQMAACTAPVLTRLVTRVYQTYFCRKLCQACTSEHFLFKVFPAPILVMRDFMTMAFHLVELFY